VRVPWPVRSAAVPAPRLPVRAVERRWSELFGYTHGTSIIARQYADGPVPQPHQDDLVVAARRPTGSPADRARSPGPPRPETGASLCGPAVSWRTGGTVCAVPGCDTDFRPTWASTTARRSRRSRASAGHSARNPRRQMAIGNLAPRRRAHDPSASCPITVARWAVRSHASAGAQEHRVQRPAHLTRPSVDRHLGCQ
jgi:hypothetical protein